MNPICLSCLHNENVVLICVTESILNVYKNLVRLKKNILTTFEHSSLWLLQARDIYRLMRPFLALLLLFFILCVAKSSWVFFYQTLYKCRYGYDHMINIFSLKVLNIKWSTQIDILCFVEILLNFIDIFMETSMYQTNCNRITEIDIFPCHCNNYDRLV